MISKQPGLITYLHKSRLHGLIVTISVCIIHENHNNSQFKYLFIEFKIELTLKRNILSNMLFPSEMSDCAS